MDEVAYQEALAGLGRLRPSRLSSSFDALTMILGPRRIARSLARKARLLGGELARIEPPADAATEHAPLVRAVQKAADDLDEVARRRGLGWRTRFDAMAEVNMGESARRALEAKGYRLPT
jgi:hypothetical protein